MSRQRPTFAQLREKFPFLRKRPAFRKPALCQSMHRGILGTDGSDRGAESRARPNDFTVVQLDDSVFQNPGRTAAFEVDEEDRLLGPGVAHGRHGTQRRAKSDSFFRVFYVFRRQLSLLWICRRIESS
jgi:hypothetical protein